MPRLFAQIGRLMGWRSPVEVAAAEPESRESLREESAAVAVADEDDAPQDQASALRGLVRNGARHASKPLDEQRRDPNAAHDRADAAPTTLDRRPHRPDNGELSPDTERVVRLVERIGAHLDQQAERAERTVQLLERLPEVVEALTDVRGNSERVREAVEQHLRAVQKRDAQFFDVIGELRGGLTSVDQSNCRSADAVEGLCRASREGREELATIVRAQNRLMTWLLGACIAVSATGVIVAIAAFVRAA